MEAQGRPTCGKVCPPKAIRRSGLLALNTLQARVQKRWREQGLEPIGLHESRHTTATWLDHAGVSPKVISEFIGHKPPDYQLGAARITLQVYTHMLPGELERARVLFDKFLVERAEDELFASWDPSGERIAFACFRRRHYEWANSIVQINADGTCETEILARKRTVFYGLAWQPGPGREAGRIDC